MLGLWTRPFLTGTLCVPTPARTMPLDSYPTAIVRILTCIAFSGPTLLDHTRIPLLGNAMKLISCFLFQNTYTRDFTAVTMCFE
ncbi:hypothetical protein EDD85DRAFT_829289 [Armillaria nabsnona]|nr:hypothetical protein EDD85DRAFT_829289 [Armillaria nabsnona]